MNLLSQHSPSTRYVWGKDLSGTLDGAGGVGGLLATEVGGVWYFPLYDNNGNVTDYVSETGEVVASYAYNAFGRTLSATGSMASVFPFRFSTKYYDAEADLYYYGYRYYSPELGRWLTRDPIEEDGGDNLYAFCGNNGVLFHDANKHPRQSYWLPFLNCRSRAKSALEACCLKIGKRREKADIGALHFDFAP